MLEKAESEKVEGLCAVRSSKAKRLRKLKPGLFNQLSGPPIVVRGMEGTGVLLAGLKHAPTVVAMKWWSRKGHHATTQRQVEQELLVRLAGAWGERVLQVFDRGYASRNWLGILQEAEGRFLIRWQKGHVVWDAAGQERQLWQRIRGKRPQERREIIELAFRYTKCELGLESPRLGKWEKRLKLLLIVTLAYVFLLSLLHPLRETMRIWLLRHWCQRTGKRCREATAPLYRLRWAISRLWQDDDPHNLLVLPKSSG